MQLDAIGSYAFLAFDVIKKPNSGDLHRHTGGLETSSRVEHRVKLCAGMGNRGGEWAAWTDAIRVGNFSDHRTARAVGYDQVIIRIIRVHILGEHGIHDPDSGFRRLDTMVIRKRTWSRKGAQIGNCGVSLGIKIDEVSILIGARLN